MTEQTGRLVQPYRAKRIQNDTVHALHFAVFLLVGVTAALISTNAYAGIPNPNCGVAVTNFIWTTIGVGINPVCDILENLNAMMMGKTGKAIATLAIAALGMAALFGKISWTTAMVVCLGVALIFGASGAMGYIGIRTVNSTLDPISSVLQTLCVAMTGEGGRAVAIVCVLIVGLGALFGKVSWIQAVTLMTGIGLVFGSFMIVNSLWDWDPLTNGVMFLSVMTDPVGGPFEALIVLLTGPMGIAIGTTLVMAMGFAAMLGKLSWTRAMLLAIGLALMFGAADVVYILSGAVAPCALTAVASDPFTRVMCGMLAELQSPMGKTLTTLAVILAGVLAMLGKISWEVGLIIMLGIAIVFGADTIVETFEISLIGINCSTVAPAPPSTGNAIADVLCYIVMILYGPAGKALATIAVIMVGFGALLGKVSFGQAAVVAAGIAVTFGAPVIVQNLMPSAVLTGCNLSAPGLGGFGGIGFGIPGVC